MFEQVTISFIIDTREHNVGVVVSQIINEIDRYTPGIIKDVDFGEVELEDAISSWGVPLSYLGLKLVQEAE